MTQAKKILIRALTSLIPCKAARKRVRASLLFRAMKKRVARRVPEIRGRQRQLEAACRARMAEGGKLRVCFLVCDISMFTAEPVYRRMSSDPAYECFIAVVPRVTRGESFLKETLKKTYATLHSRYGESVVLMYDAETRKTASLEGRADIVFTSIIYEEQSCPEFTVENMSAYALVALISYGYSGLFRTNLAQTIFLPNIVFAWRFFTSCRETMELWTRTNPQLQANAVLSGYAKMDRLSEFGVREPKERKRIIVSPHHSLARGTDGLSLSNFLRLSDVFLELPAKYPQVDFVFRPHPLLFPRLSTPEWWGEAKTLEWRRRMESCPNVEFQQGGDYFETFATSSALIHDCGSFLAEYFYTSNPQCYLFDDNTEEQFLPMGRKLLSYVYHARTREDIFDFIDRVVLGGDDAMKEERLAFARSSVCMFYPHAADRVCEIVMEAISGRKERK